MIIVAIRRRKGRRDSWQIHLDGGDPVELGGEIIMKYGLRTGQELSEDRLRTLEEENSRQQGLNKAVELLSYRDHSRKELRDKLKQKGFGNVTDAILQHMEEAGYLNDDAFAERYFEELKNGRSLGPLLIRRKLQEKGIGREIVDRLLETYDEDEQVQKAQQLLLKKKIRDTKDLTRPEREKAGRYLLQKGFTMGILACVLRSGPESFS